MKVIVFFLALALASPCVAKDKRSLWQKMFVATKKEKTVKKRSHGKKSSPERQTNPKPTSTPIKEAPRNGNGFFIVSAQWYANYLVREAAWDYYVPDDDGIKFIDGKYHVPPVVYRHFEDLVSAGDPKR